MSYSLNNIIIDYNNTFDDWSTYIIDNYDNGDNNDNNDNNE